MERYQLVRIGIDHPYERESQYMHMGSDYVNKAPSHLIEIALQDGALMLEGKLVYSN